MPQRYRDLIAPSLVDVAARSTPTGASEAAERLSQSLLSFQRTTSDLGERLSSQAGTRAGEREGAAGAPKFRGNLRALSAYGRAYNDAAMRSYAIKAETDMEDTAARLETEAGTNPDTFREAMTEVRDSVLQEAPEQARTVVSQIYDRRTAQGLARIQSALVKELRDEDRTLVSEQMSRSSEKIAFLRSQDSPEAAAEAEEEQIKLQMLIDAAVGDGTLSESEGRVVRQQTEYGIISATVRQRFQNEINDPYGDPVGFIEDLKEMNRTAEVLPPEEEVKLENELLAELRDRNALRSLRESQADAAAQARHEAGDRLATTGLLAGELTQRDLLQLTANDEITPAVARTLLNELQSAATRPAKSNQETLFHFKTNLLSYTEEEIASERGLTWEDRYKLILERRDEETGWKSTQDAKEAFDRIDRELDIVEGTPLRLLSDAEKRARDRALTELYNRIDVLPPEERQGALMAASQEVIRDVIKNNASIKLERTISNLQVYKNSMGDPSNMDERTRRQYDVEVQRLERRIAELEQQVRN